MPSCIVTEGPPDQDGLTAKTCSVCGNLYPPSPPGFRFVSNCKLATVCLPPGAWLMRLLALLGAKPDDATACGCVAMAKKMDAWGPSGCREHRPEIVTHLQKSYSRLNWSDVGMFARRAIACGLAWKINPLDICGSLVDEAIRLAEQSALQPLGAQ